MTLKRLLTGFGTQDISINLTHVVFQTLFLTGLEITYLKEDRELSFWVFIPTGPILKPGFLRAPS